MLSRVIVLERGVILSEEDVANILKARDKRFRKEAERALRTEEAEKLTIRELVSLLARRIGL